MFSPLSPVLLRTLPAFDDYIFSMLPPEKLCGMYYLLLLSTMTAIWSSCRVESHAQSG